MHTLAVSVSGRQSGTPYYALAAKWYGEAAAYRLADSQFNLGILAEHGLGGTKNLSEAYKWFALAAKGGDQEAAKRRDLVKAQLAAADLAAAEQAVAAWTAKVPAPDANGVEDLRNGTTRRRRPIRRWSVAPRACSTSSATTSERPTA